jgi:hypothetical protein
MTIAIKANKNRNQKTNCNFLRADTPFPIDRPAFMSELVSLTQYL